MRMWTGWMLVLALVGCGGSTTDDTSDTQDVGVETTSDTGSTDTGPLDTGAVDTGSLDTGPGDLPTHPPETGTLLREEFLQEGFGALHRGALHVEVQAAEAAEFFAAARSTRTTVDLGGEYGTRTGRVFRDTGTAQREPAVVGGDSQHHGLYEVAIVRIDGRYKPASTKAYPVTKLIGIRTVRHERGGRAKDLMVMDRVGVAGIVSAKQSGRDKVAFAIWDAHQLPALTTVNQLSAALEVLHAGQHVFDLSLGRHRAHADFFQRGIANAHFSESIGEVGDDALDHVAMHEDAPGSRALLPRFLRDLLGGLPNKHLVGVRVEAHAGT